MIQMYFHKQTRIQFMVPFSIAHTLFGTRTGQRKSHQGAKTDQENAMCKRAISHLSFKGMNPRTRDPPPSSAIAKTFVLTTSILNGKKVSQNQTLHDELGSGKAAFFLPKCKIKINGWVSSDSGEERLLLTSIRVMPFTDDWQQAKTETWTESPFRTSAAGKGYHRLTFKAFFGGRTIQFWLQTSQKMFCQKIRFGRVRNDVQTSLQKKNCRLPYFGNSHMSILSLSFAYPPSLSHSLST